MGSSPGLKAGRLRGDLRILYRDSLDLILFSVRFTFPTCCPYRNSGPNIGMVESAEFRHRCDRAAMLDGPPQRRVLVESEMGPVGVVVFRISAKQPTEYPPLSA